MANVIELMALGHYWYMTVVRCVIHDLLWYVPVRDYGIPEFKQAKNLRL